MALMGSEDVSSASANANGEGSPREGAPVSGLVELGGEAFYRVAAFDRLPPFFLTVVSPDDHWLFASSRGGLTAGRRDPDHALFPYTTDDRIHDSAGLTGPVSVLFVERDGETIRWEPFRVGSAADEVVERSLYKSVHGSKLAFEEHHPELELTFRYEWGTSQRFGFVRRCTLENHGATTAQVRMLDGLANLLPAGVGRRLQSDLSTLVDAYKRSELLTTARMGIFRLGSLPVDRAEPSEALRASVAWLHGLPGARLLLSERQVEDFRRGTEVCEEREVRGVRQAFLVRADLEVAAGACGEWSIVADTGLDAPAVERLLEDVTSRSDLGVKLGLEVDRAGADLRSLVAEADGLQSTGSALEDARHFSNTLFNIMRGGVFIEGHQIPADELRLHVERTSPVTAQRRAECLAGLPDLVDVSRLRELVEASGDEDLARVVREFLPLHFSRRHGDPSRPWNSFTVPSRSRHGGPSVRYEGNWRDIFQNWEALCASYPEFIECTIARFVNASTPDGYNAYRLTHEGLDWEILDPEDPWSNIGYWGDHQIVYLGRLLELCERRSPGRLGAMLEQRQFVYADVPYRIRPYEDLIRDPQDTIDYDAALAAALEVRVREEGQDGKLARDAVGYLHTVGLIEKLFLPALAKITNLVPELGIWMNTQRPEWNDANNALVGYGCSVVTLAHLHRYLGFLEGLVHQCSGEEVELSVEVSTLFGEVVAALSRHQALLAGELDSRARRAVMDDLGLAGEKHRRAVYAGFRGEYSRVPTAELAEFCQMARSWTEHTLRSNRRSDGLFHAYNLLEFEGDGGAGVRRLDVMLEGQVAVLACGLLSTGEVLGVLDALRSSPLFREDQHSYLLYPDRARPRFLEQNRVPLESVERSSLLSELLARGEESIVVQGPGGIVRFAAELRNGGALDRALDRLAEDEAWAGPVESGREELQAIYEDVFEHRAFTGRSGSFYGYEGLGCIYWHQVSKLLLAVFEVIRDGCLAGADRMELSGLARHYADIRIGLGTHKSPQVHGAIPVEPYSHTPGAGGAQQPGMTGQVKEDFLTRMGELGVWVDSGQIRFEPGLLDPGHWSPSSGGSAFAYITVDGAEKEVVVPPRSVAFTVCQTPVVIQRAEASSITVRMIDGAERTFEGTILDRETSALVLSRSGQVESVAVSWHGSPLLELA